MYKIKSGVYVYRVFENNIHMLHKIKELININ